MNIQIHPLLLPSLPLRLRRLTSRSLCWPARFTLLSTGRRNHLLDLRKLNPVRDGKWLETRCLRGPGERCHSEVVQQVSSGRVRKDVDCLIPA